MHPLETYLRHLREIRATGAGQDETSFYPPLANLLNEVGSKLKPRVRCVINLANKGAGMPDGGLFTKDQFAGKVEPGLGDNPSRGVIECKPPKYDAWLTADTGQVTKYWNKYRQVLVTNYRDFLLIGQEEGGKQSVKLESFRLAASEKEFWQAAAHPGSVVDTLGDRFLEFLQRVILHPAALGDPKDVAWFLASYARDARTRIEAAADLPALATVRQALAEALGIQFEGEKGDHFFRSTLVQTLFYGVFSAWVLWHRSGRRPSDRFDWEKSAKYLHVPILRKLFHELADPGKLEEWRLDEVLNWTGAALNRVDRAAFFAKFEETEAVQYFYEPFLEAFDPELRKQLGVWYTPPEIVRYMVARVDTVLREDLGRPDGLADPDVYILDPCCGTGAYLVEVLRTVAATLKDKGEDALLAAKLKEAATKRIFGFEILPAPFVVAHLQLGLFLHTEGVPLDDKKHERAGVYLTNALTGWEPPKGPKIRYLFTEMEEEHDRAEAVKQKKPILVVLGNPPYNGFAGVAVAEERDLSTAYRWKAGDPPDLKPQGQGLNDLYVRFFRMAERCIVERGVKHGVVCFISNYSWLDGLSFPLMRQRYLNEFDAIWIDCLNGDKYKTGKVTPDGKPDPSVFSTEQNREGIQVGTSIALLIRRHNHNTPASVQFRDLWGLDKKQQLLTTLPMIEASLYKSLAPAVPLSLPFRPMGTDKGYLTWPLMSEFFQTWFTGVKTSRDDVVVDIDRQTLVERIESYFDPSITHAEMAAIAPRAVIDAARFDAIATREVLQKRGFLRENVIPFAYRPFDLRWLYWEPTTKLLDEKRDEYYPHIFGGNLSLVAAQQNRKDYDPPSVLRRLASIHIIERSANVFPLMLKEWNTDDGLYDDAKLARRLGTHFANLSDAALSYLHVRGGVEGTPHLFHHVVATLHAPSYAMQNAGALRQGWPRVPLPDQRELLEQSSALGRHVAALLDTETAVPGVTAGKVRHELKVIGVPARVGKGSLNAAAGDLDVTAHWGIAGKGGICMPSKGKLSERAFSAEEMKALSLVGSVDPSDTKRPEAWLANVLADFPDHPRDTLGETTFDIYLNDIAFWRNVPIKVWEYTLGGYQVMKKWLSYREKSLLGRGLTLDEVTHVQNMSRRIAALLLLGPALDANYQAVKAATYAWPNSKPQHGRTDTIA